VADVEHVASQLDAAPVLVGHSMGAAVLERMMATRPVRGAALIAPVPPTGLLPVAARLAATRPDYISHMMGLDPSRLSQRILEALRPFYFSAEVDPAILRQAIAHLNNESPRVLFDLSMRLHWIEPQASSPVFVLGATGDRIAIPTDVEATARHHGVHATILPGMGHMLMLEPQWRIAAEAIADWMERL
jgi:non-heme chloroperoxidase